MIKVKNFFSFKLFVTVTILATQAPIHAHSIARAAATKIKLTQPTKRTQSLIKTDCTNTQPCLPTSDEDKDTDVREVTFTNDLIDVVKLDLQCQHPSSGERENKCLEHFQDILITVRAEKEYDIIGDSEVSIETKDSWELSIHEISNEALLSLKTFRDLVLDHFMPKKRIVNFMDEWVWTPYNQAKLFIYQKVIARYATTTIIIHVDIDPDHKMIRFSDILLDLDKLAGENKLAISIEHESLLNMKVTINPVRHSSLPNAFF